MSALVSPDRYVLQAPLQMRFVDAAGLETVYDDLEIKLTNSANRYRTFMLRPTKAGWWTADVVPGVRSDQVFAEPPDTTETNEFEVSVVDRAGRFLPCRFIAEIPAKGPFTWNGWSVINRQNRIVTLLKPGQETPDYIPLFSKPGRTFPIPMGQVSANIQTRTAEGDVPAAWAILRIRSGNRTVGLGLADEKGNVEAAFAYPDLPSTTAAEAVDGRANITWPLRIAIHYEALPVEQTTDGAAQENPPVFSEIFDQIDQTAKRGLRKIDETDQLPNPDLEMGRPLILRTRDTNDDELSSLFLMAS